MNIDNYFILTSKDKIQYFLNLKSIQDRQAFFATLPSDYKKEILNILPIDNLKSFVTLLPTEVQFEIYDSLIDSSRLSELYSVFSIDNQQDKYERDLIKYSLNERQKRLKDEDNQKISDIATLSGSIDMSRDSITSSKKNIKDDKYYLKIDKGLLKDTKRQLNKSQNIREMQLRRAAITASILSFVNVGFIRRHYVELDKSIKNTEMQIEQLTSNRNNLYLKMNNLKKDIAENEKSISEQRSSIAESKAAIKENLQEFRSNRIELKAISKTEKQILGRRLYRKRVSTNEYVMPVRRQMVEKIENNIGKKKDSPKLLNEVDTSRLGEIISSLGQSGVDVSTSTEGIDKNQSNVDLSNPNGVADKKKEAQIIDFFAAKERLENKAQEAAMAEGTGPTYKKGIVDYKLLLFIVLLLIGIILIVCGILI